MARLVDHSEKQSKLVTVFAIYLQIVFSLTTCNVRDILSGPD